jgi:hypothetical protein
VKCHGGSAQHHRRFLQHGHCRLRGLSVSGGFPTSTRRSLTPANTCCALLQPTDHLQPDHFFRK